MDQESALAHFFGELSTAEKNLRPPLFNKITYRKRIYVLPSLFLSVNYLDGHCSIVYLMKALKLDLSCLDYSLDLGLDLSLSTNRAQSR